MIKFIVLLILCFFDILSKYLVFNFIRLNDFVPLFYFVDLIHIHNYGVSFGLFSGLIPSWILILLGSLIVFFIFYLMKNAKNNFEKWGFLIIISGAISNIFDRILNGYVIDFIFLNYQKYYWPAFNFADIYITIGILMLMSTIIIKFDRIKK
ncbi:MAG: signal peptidase II [Pelagibacteraceae bacterium]|nr:signal peptidase II [Pelagibacteraceae bacterium]